MFVIYWMRIWDKNKYHNFYLIKYYKALYNYINVYSL